MHMQVEQLSAFELPMLLAAAQHQSGAPAHKATLR